MIRKYWRYGALAIIAVAATFAWVGCAHPYHGYHHGYQQAPAGCCQGHSQASPSGIPAPAQTPPC